MKGRAVKLVASVCPGLLLLFLRPMGMSLQQSAVSACLLMVVIWWVTGLVERTVASGVLLVCFFLVSGAPVRTILTFPLSENFIMIAVSFLFSQGIMNSGLAERLLEPLLFRHARTPARLLAAMILCSGVVMLFIPQSISRVIIVASIFSHFFEELGLDRELKAVLMFGLFFTSIFLGLLMIRGDLVLNYGLMTVSGITLTEEEWVRLITVPTAVFLLLSVGLYALLYRRTLAAYRPVLARTVARATLTRKEKGLLAFLLLVAAAWGTEPLHHISGTVVVCAGTALMAPLGLLGAPDLKSVNLKLLFFLTAAFSIGGVMKACGVADLLFSGFIALFPKTFSPSYALAVLGTAMILHMLLGSNVTTLSVVVPGLLTVSAGVAPPLLVSLLAYIAVSGHFILPFHHVTLLVGEGEGWFTARQVVRFGLPLTVLTLFTGLVLYLGWWRLLGIL